MRLRIAVIATLVLAALAGGARAQDAFYLGDGETVIFFGDSITEGGQYIAYVETFLRTRFPGIRIEIINAGISSETISGTSEADHSPRRPWAHDRFARDIASRAPTAVVSCFGMNDGNYYPYDAERFAKYQAGVLLLIARVRDETGARLTILTPPPFDPYRRSAGDPEAKEYGYKFPAVDYDETLGTYAEWLMSLRSPWLVVADVHSEMNAHLARRREGQVSFYLSGDGVHPGPTGHWLMAQSLLAAWGAPATVSEAVIDAGAGRALAGEVDGIGETGGVIRATWTTSLPMAMDPRWDAKSIALEDVANRLNRHRLAVVRARAPRYRLLADGAAVAEVTREILAKGVDLTQYPAFPTNKASLQVLGLVEEKQRTVYRAWRASLVPAREGETAKDGGLEAAEKRAAEIDAKIDDLCAPKAVAIELQPLP
ncbi:MAG: SGNH/GDSL hydrolase family protein [Planctomycetes bacterium]|nr:SGNH/GDSL hydrolase family protein [Planctomycetota bacterium]